MAGRSVSWRRDGAILERMRIVERLHLAGKSNRAIAEVVGADEGTVRNDLKRLAELWVETVKDQQINLRAAVIAELEDTRIRALDAYDFDRRMEEAVMTGGDFARDDGDDRPIYRDEKGSASFRGGKAASLSVALNATEKKAKVLGLVVDKTSLTDNDGNSLAELILKARADGPDR